MMSKRYRKPGSRFRILHKTHQQHGVAQAAAMMMLIFLSLIGIAAITTSTIELDIAGNEKQALRAFYAADSGWRASVNYLDLQYPGITESKDTADIDFDIFGTSRDEIPVSYDKGDVTYSVDITFNGATIIPGYSTDFKRYMYTINSTGNAPRNAQSQVKINAGKIYHVGGY